MRGGLDRGCSARSLTLALSLLEQVTSGFSRNIDFSRPNPRSHRSLGGGVFTSANEENRIEADRYLPYRSAYRNQIG